MPTKHSVPDTYGKACECEGCDECLHDEVQCIRGALVQVTTDDETPQSYAACGSCADFATRESEGNWRVTGLAGVQ